MNFISYILVFSFIFLPQKKEDIKNINNVSDLNYCIERCLIRFKQESYQKYNKITGVKIKSDKQGNLKSFAIFFDKEEKLSKKEYKMLFKEFRQYNYLNIMLMCYDDIENEKFLYFQIKFTPSEKSNH
jgi:hypothetical protein